MRILESKPRATTNKENAEKPGVFGSIKLPLNRQAQRIEDYVIQTLNRGLDYQVVCLRNFFPSDTSRSLNLVLAAPQGIYLLHISRLKGVFRTVGENWEELDVRSKKFRRAKENLLLETRQMARQVDIELARIGIKAPKTEPVIYFSEPGAHVDAEQPSVRIFQIDAIDRFFSGILRLPISVGPEVIDEIADKLGESLVSQKQSPAQMNERDIFSLHEPEKKKSLTDSPLLMPVMQEPRFLKKIQFSKGQWFFLSFLLIITILILVTLVITALVLT